MNSKPASSFPAGACLELTNARITDVKLGRYFDPGVRLVLQHGKIAAMPGLPDQPEIHPDFSLDLGGRTVIPGLTNTHSHLQLNYPTLLAGLGDLGPAQKYGPQQVEKRLSDCLKYGVTNIRDALSSDLRPNQRVQERLQRGEISGPRLHQCVLVSPEGGTYTKRPGLFDLLIAWITGSKLLAFDRPESGIVCFPADAGDQRVRAAIDEAIDRHGAGFIKLYDQREFSPPAYKPGARILTDAQLAAAVDQCRRRGVLATMHHVTVESFRRGVQAGVHSLAHLPLDGPLSDADIRAFIAAGTILEPTLSVAYYLGYELPGAAWNGTPLSKRLKAFRASSYASLADAFWVPELAPGAKSMYAKASQGKFKMLGIIDLSPSFRYWGRFLAQGADNLRRLYAGGATLAFGNDAGAAPAAEGMVGLELALLGLFLNPETGASVFCGADALRAATLHSARSLGIEGAFGSLEPGKTADLAILDGDPLADPAAIGQPVAALFKDGQLVVNACGL